MVRIEVHWPEMDLPNEDSDQNNLFDKWSNDPFLRKVLYALYMLLESIFVMLMVVLTFVGLLSIYAVTDLPATADTVFWMGLLVALIYLAADEFISNYWKSPIKGISRHVAFWIFRAVAAVAGWIKRRRPFTPSLTEDDIDIPIEFFPVLDMFRRNNERNKF